MSSLMPAVAPRSHPDAARIAALSATLALNLTALLVLTRPQAAVWSTAPRERAPAAELVFIEPPPPLPPPVPEIELAPLPPTPAPIRRSVPAPLPAPATPPLTSAEGSQPLPVVAPPGPEGAGTGAPVEATLAYVAAPLSYPAPAIRRRLEGTVLLRVLVDTDGRPVEVQVERGSGHALLDRSAREQVLAGWRFQPAVVGGRAVQAWARVPVQFSLREL